MADAADWGEKPYERVTVRADVAEVLEEYHRVLPPEEARNVLAAFDMDASRRMGVVRGGDRQARLAAMQMVQEGRAQGPPANPLQALGNTLLSGIANRVGRFMQQQAQASGVPTFPYSMLQAATANFSAGQQLGRGSYGPVYRGVLNTTPVAVKVLDPQGTQGEREFLREVSILARLRHPHITALVGACKDSMCLVYELAQRGSLHDLLHAPGAAEREMLTWQARVRVAGEVAAALAYMHGLQPEGIYHRDLKAANILLDENWRAKVADVGLARFFGGDSAAGDSRVVGTEAYVDPEYLRTKKFEAASDVYSFGIVLMEMLTGRPPQGLPQLLSRAKENNTVQQVLDPNAGPCPLPVASALASMALKCTAYERGERPGLVQDIVPDLRTLQGTLDDIIRNGGATAGQGAQVAGEAAGKVASDEPPELYVCPITQDVMVEPVIAADGYTYEKQAIEAWLGAGHWASPMTN